MIVINAIAIDGGFAPETIPSSFVGSLFDGTNFIYFETAQEQIDYLASLQVWSKEAHLAEINALHKAEFQRRYIALDYEDGWDIVLYSQRPELGYQEEANQLLEYWTNGWDIIKTYSETVTEQNMIDPIQFVNNLENG